MTTPKPDAGAVDARHGGNFIRAIIERDIEQGAFPTVRTRFPPEPNGYLHIGHAKSICLNFGLAREYGGVCHLRFDDTNPEKEEQEYVDAIADAVKWLGFDWTTDGTAHLYFASNYFDFMYRAAEALVVAGLAYVDEQTADEIRQHRGDFATPGVDSPFRTRTPDDNLARLREMKAGLHADGAMVLRAKIDMASPNINLRDPALYRIKRATHHNTGDAWCIYPMYTFAHPIEDALEHISHSLCTLEFEDQRPFYDWLLASLADLGLLTRPLPRQHEFARLNVTYVVTSKRKLRQLVSDGHVAGWDDPRMPTIAGLRRRGYTPESLQLFCERSGVSKSGGWMDYGSLDIALRDDLDPKAARAMAVLDPLRLVLTNWNEVMGAGTIDICDAPVHPAHAERGRRTFGIGRDVWIERDDFQETPTKGYFRLFPGNKVRLKYGHIVECTGCTKDADGRVVEVQATLVPDTKSGTPGADAVKVKTAITWVSAHDGLMAEVRLFERLFTDEHPDAGGKDFLAALNPASRKVATAIVEPSLATAAPDTRFQFERHGYFVADRVDHTTARPVFNRTTTLRDTFTKP